MNAFAFLAMVTIDTDLMAILCLNYHVVLIDLCWLLLRHHHNYLTLPPQFWSHPEHWNLTQIVDVSSVLLNDLWMHKKWWHFRFVLLANMNSTKQWNWMWKMLRCEGCSCSHSKWIVAPSDDLCKSKIVCPLMDYDVYDTMIHCRCEMCKHQVAAGLKMWQAFALLSMDGEGTPFVNKSKQFVFYPSLIFLVKQLMVLPMGYKKPLSYWLRCHLDYCEYLNLWHHMVISTQLGIPHAFILFTLYIKKENSIFAAEFFVRFFFIVVYNSNDSFQTLEFKQLVLCRERISISWIRSNNNVV